jgi:hypothetical protein
LSGWRPHRFETGPLASRQHCRRSPDAIPKKSGNKAVQRPRAPTQNPLTPTATNQAALNQAALTSSPP